MSTTIFCIAPSQTVANDIVSGLRTSGVADHHISVLFPDGDAKRIIEFQTNTKAPEGATAGVSAGGVVGGTLGLLAGIGLLAIPGLGPFIAAGPIMAALAGMTVGATVGGITGALIGLGIPEVEAKSYENKIKDGKILISVRTETSEEQATVKRVFEEHKATDIATGSLANPSATRPAAMKPVSPLIPR